MPFAFKDSNILTAWLGGTTSSSVPCYGTTAWMNSGKLPVLPNHSTTTQWVPLQGRMGENSTTKHARSAAVLPQAVSCLFNVAAGQQRQVNIHLNEPRENRV